MVHMDVPASSAIADGFNRSAEAVGGVPKAIEGFAFGPEKSGRSHKDGGTTVKNGYVHIAAMIKQMSTSSANVGNNLRGCIAEYTGVDKKNANNMKKA